MNIFFYNILSLKDIVYVIYILLYIYITKLYESIIRIHRKKYIIYILKVSKYIKMLQIHSYVKKCLLMQMNLYKYYMRIRMLEISNMNGCHKYIFCNTIIIRIL